MNKPVKVVTIISKSAKDKPKLSDDAKKSKYPYIYQFLIKQVYDEKLSRCSAYVEDNADLFYSIILEFVNTHPIPENDANDDDEVHDIFYKSPKLDDEVYSAIFSVSPFPLYMDPGASAHIDELNEDIYEIAFEGFKAFNRDYQQKLKEQKELQKSMTSINNELKALPPSTLLPIGGIEYQEALERNIDKFM